MPDRPVRLTQRGELVLAVAASLAGLAATVVLCGLFYGWWVA